MKSEAANGGRTVKHPGTFFPFVLRTKLVGGKQSMLNSLHQNELLNDGECRDSADYVLKALPSRRHFFEGVRLR